MDAREHQVPCEVIQDILPLYYDRVCSGQSRLLVEAHLPACEKCRRVLQALEENERERGFRAEIRQILRGHEKRERSMAAKTGVMLAAILVLPVVIALLLTLPGYSDWRTNAVLISSMLLVAGMTVVPLVSTKKRGSKTIIFSTAALLLVIFSVEMLFDDGGLLRFGEIACSVVFGLSLFLFPVVIWQAELPAPLRKQKGLLTMGWDTLWFYLMIFMFAIDYPASLGELVSVSSYFVAAVWLIFAAARYAKANWWVKAGLIVVIAGVWAAAGSAQGWITITERDIHRPLLLASLAAGGVLVLLGVVLGRRRPTAGKNAHR